MTDLKRRSFIAALGATPFALPLLSKAESLLSNFNDNQTAQDPLNVHSTSTTDLNTHDPTAIITLQGLGLGCFGPSGYVNGFVHDPEHRYMLAIKESGPGARRLLRAPQRVNGNLRIEVENPVREGIFRYEKGEFSRPNGSTDERHFRWILDLEGERMHERQLSLRRLNTPGTRPIYRVSIPHATFYTKRLGSTVYTRIDHDKADRDPGLLLGRIAQEVGAAIECKPGDGSGVRIVFAKGDPLFLPRVEGLKYEIILYNLRPDHLTHQMSDFPLFYKVLRDPGGRQFNLAHVQPNLASPPNLKVFDNLYRPRGCCGAACDNGILSRTTSLVQSAPA
jgi:hypothetical protein